MKQDVLRFYEIWNKIWKLPIQRTRLVQVIKFLDKIFNKEVAQIMYKANASYVIK